MGLDKRIGPSFLRPGVGYGGSCFDRGETILVRHYGTPKLLTFEQLWDLCGGDDEAVAGEAIEPPSLEAWSWVPGESQPEWMPVSVLTKREYDGEMVEVRTKMGRRLTVTADHPFIVGDGNDDAILTRVLARDLSDSDWLPLALGCGPGFAPALLSLAGVVEDAVVEADAVMVRPETSEVAALAARPPRERHGLEGHPHPAQRMGDIKRTGVLRFNEACESGVDLRGAAAATVRNGTWAPFELDVGPRFWRVVGLYLAEGCVSADGATSKRQRIIWSFHPDREEHLVEEVAGYWRDQGVKVSVRRAPTARHVEVSSRILAAWWTGFLGLGRTRYEQRLPRLIWEQTAIHKRALLSGLWEGDGSWSLVNGGPSVILEWGTISDELADGVTRLLADVGIVAGWRRGSTAKSTKETHWLRVSGADQVERAQFLIPDRHRDQVLDVITHQAKRIKPAGYRRFGEGPAWVRVTSTRAGRSRGAVHSLKVPGSQTVVVSGGLAVSQCFPKDVSALKMLAGNTGYHFQLLTSVIEVNELQKRRVVAKLQKHLGSLAGRRIALLGLAFKPDTDDMREASSLVLASRLRGEGAEVIAFDPVAAKAARELLPDVEMTSSAEAALAGADAVVLVTEWEEFADLDWGALGEKMATPLVIDGRNFLDPEALRAAGFAYEGIGRPAPSASAVES
jgi:UDPglucose 6-dehydrogenase